MSMKHHHDNQDPLKSVSSGASTALSPQMETMAHLARAILTPSLEPNGWRAPQPSELWELTANALGEATGKVIYVFEEAITAARQLQGLKIGSAEEKMLMRSGAEALETLITTLQQNLLEKEGSVSWPIAELTALKLAVISLSFTKDPALLEQVLQRGGTHLRHATFDQFRSHVRNINSHEGTESSLDPVIVFLRAHAPADLREFHEYFMPVLRECGERAVSVFNDLLLETEGNIERTRSILYHLGCLGSSAGVPIIEGYINSQEFSVRETAQNALKKLRR